MGHLYARSVYGGHGVALRPPGLVYHPCFQAPGGAADPARSERLRPAPPGRARTHERGLAHHAGQLDPTTGDGSFTPQLPGVSIDRRDTDEGSDSAAIELAEFG